MPNRYLRQSYIESETVNKVGWQAEVVWTRLLVVVDDFGRCEANIRLLRPKLFPLKLDQIREADLQRCIAECENAGLVRLYKSDGKDYLQMMKWEKGRAEGSKYPAPPPEIANSCLQPYTAANSRIQKKTCTPTPTPISDSAPDAASEGESIPPSYFPEVERPGENEVKEYAKIIGLSEWKALDWFEEMQGCNWKDYQRREIHDWRAVMRRVKTKWEADGRPNQPPTRLIPGEKPRGKSIHEQDAERMRRQVEKI